MPPHNRLPNTGQEAGPPGSSPPFCHIEREEKSGGSRHSVVHTASPKFVVEFEDAPGGGGPGPDGMLSPQGPPVIRRVCVPNSWVGDYHRCARQLTSAMRFFESARARKA